MDLVSTIRKSGSRGGVNFSWDEVANSAHRENYLGHSLKAPVGRWQAGRDLQWYAKADSDNLDPNETEEERKARLRREEIQKIKEAEEDAMAKALGLPPPVRNQSGSNAIEVSGSRLIEDQAVPGGLQTNAKKEGKEEARRGRRHQDRDERRDRSDREHRHRHRHRSHSRGKDSRRRGDRDDEGAVSSRHDGRRDRNRSRSRDPERHTRNRRHDPSHSRSRSPDHRRRSRSRNRDGGRYRRRSPDTRRSPRPDRRRGER